MFSKGLTGQSVRVIKTSLITEVKEPNDSFPRSFKIKTENSEYSILILDKIESKLVEDFIDECFNKADPILEKYMERFDSQQPKSIN
jgi:hypothetical protein